MKKIKKIIYVIVLATVFIIISSLFVSKSFASSYVNYGLLEPGCGPSDSDCKVAPPAISSDLNALSSFQKAIVVDGKTRAVEYIDSSNNIVKIDIYNDSAVTDYSDANTTGSIRWAIEQLGNNGGLVNLYSGVYHISNPIVIDYDWITLQGANFPNWDKLSDTPTASPGGAQILVPSGGTGITIGTTRENMHGDSRHKGIAIRDLNFLGQNVASYGIYDESLTDVSQIRDCGFFGFETAAIHIGWDAADIKGNNIQKNNGDGIVFINFTPIRIEGNIIWDNGGNSIHFTYNKGVPSSQSFSTIIGNTCNGNIVLNPNGVTVIGNTAINIIETTPGSNNIAGNVAPALLSYKSLFNVQSVISSPYGDVNLINKVASGNVRNICATVERSFHNTYENEYGKINFPAVPLGTIRVSFDIKSGNGSTVTAYLLDMDDNPIGTEQTTTSQTYVTISQDISVSSFMGKGNSFRLIAKSAGSTSYVYIKNFRISYDNNPLVTVPSSGTNTTDESSDLVLRGLGIKEGSNAKMGTVNLVEGTATVSTTAVKSTSRIFLTTQTIGTVETPKQVAVTSISEGSFTITSSDATDTSKVAWLIIDPY
jgi:hypothetical protein